MNRPLKFRFWDGQKIMLDWSCIMQTAFNQINVATQHQAKEIFDPLLYNLFFRHRLGDKSVMMQFTGILDKNGREIYEGDLVKAWNTGHQCTMQVVWGEPSASFFLYRERGGLIWNISGSALAREDNRYQDNGIEIIGNIYEHPEIWAQTKLPVEQS